MSTPTLIALTVAFGCASLVRANEADETTLLVPGKNPGQVQRVEVTLELRGIAIAAEGSSFNLYDSESATSRWVRLNDTHRGFKVSQYHPAENSVTLLSASQSVTLVLSRGRTADASDSMPKAPVRPNLPDFHAHDNAVGEAL